MITLLLERIKLERSRLRYRCTASFPGAAARDVKALVSGIELADDVAGNAGVLSFFAQRDPRTVVTFRTPGGTVHTLEVEVALVDPAPASTGAVVTLSAPLDVEGWLQILFVVELAPN